MKTDETLEHNRKTMVEWRQQQLVVAGSDPHHAQLIAERFDIKIEDAISLLQNNCPPNLMVAILL